MEGDQPLGQCQGRTQKGQKCGFRTKAGSAFCKNHGPENQTLKGLPGSAALVISNEERLLMKKGESSTDVADLVTKVQQNRLARALEMQNEILKLETLEDLRAFVITVIQDTRNRVLEAKSAAAINSMVNTLKDIMNEIKKPEDLEKHKQAQVIIMVENMSVEETWQFIQNPDRGLAQIADQAIIDYNPKAELPKALIEGFKKKVKKDADVLFGDSPPITEHLEAVIEQKEDDEDV